VALGAARDRGVPRLPDPDRPVPDGGRGRGRAWLILIAVPLAFTDLAVHRLPDPLTATAFTGTLALLTAAALAGHQPGHLARAAIGAAALACFYLALCLIRPGEMGLGDSLTELRRCAGRAVSVTERGCFFALRAVSGA